VIGFAQRSFVTEKYFPFKISDFSTMDEEPQTNDSNTVKNLYHVSKKMFLFVCLLVSVCVNKRLKTEKKKQNEQEKLEQRLMLDFCLLEISMFLEENNEFANNQQAMEEEVNMNKNR
jgi:hypothetical protein